jgi:hypothetical protein
MPIEKEPEAETFFTTLVHEAENSLLFPCPINQSFETTWFPQICKIRFGVIKNRHWRDELEK